MPVLLGKVEVGEVFSAGVGQHIITGYEAPANPGTSCLSYSYRDPCVYGIASLSDDNLGREQLVVVPVGVSGALVRAAFMARGHSTPRVAAVVSAAITNKPPIVDAMEMDVAFVFRLRAWACLRSCS